MRSFLESITEFQEIRATVEAGLTAQSIPIVPSASLLEMVQTLAGAAIPVTVEGIELSDLLVDIGGYVPCSATAGSADFGATADASGYSSFLQSHCTMQIRQQGPIAKLEMFFGTIPATLTSFYVSIWRRDTGATTYTRQYRENFFSQLNSGLATFIPSTTWQALPGDLFGIDLTWSGGGMANWMWLKTNQVGGYSDLNLHWSMSDVGGDNVDWFALPYPVFSIIPIKAYCLSYPTIISIGDSLTDGSPLTMCGSNTVGTTYLGVGGVYGTLSSGKRSQVSRTNDPMYYIGQHYGVTYQNLGCGAAGSQVLSSRIVTDVMPRRPRIVITDLGMFNDGWLQPSDADRRAYQSIILSSIVNGGALPVVPILNWGAGNTAYVTDFVNNVLPNHPSTVVLDLTSAMLDGDNLISEYSYDGTHFTLAGVQAYAAAVIAGINATIAEL